ncbi:Sperm-specific antigen 2-like protein [Heterocephalus glaber]|uniref:Sperm-specific antigen 2-like protein n=1 Tax=Heterocephalus glaber TaxID=10181 RepID=G5AV40_HETGA|nr:Sperm-specific antigen 2-like protein [Heterocephalus glaber]
MRTLSPHSVPNIPGSTCAAFASPLWCPHSHSHAVYPYRACSGNPPSAIEMQLRRVLHHIRSSLQNLSQYPMMRGPDLAAVPYSTQKSSVFPLYENTFQELQVMRQSLNLFRTQMMDLKLVMLCEQTLVYQHMTEEERYEVGQLQSLGNSVRVELQDLELQLEERLLGLDEQLQAVRVPLPFSSFLLGICGSRSADNLSCPSPLNVVEPVTELMREQSYLKSELGLGLEEMAFENPPGESSESVCSRATTGFLQTPPELESSEEVGTAEEGPQVAGPNSDVEEECGKLSAMPAAEEMQRNVEQDELQQVIREIKESIVGKIRHEIERTFGSIIFK